MAFVTEAGKQLVFHDHDNLDIFYDRCKDNPNYCPLNEAENRLLKGFHRAFQFREAVIKESLTRACNLGTPTITFRNK